MAYPYLGEIVASADATKAQLRLAAAYSQLRLAVDALEQCQGEEPFTEVEAKQLDLAHVCLRMGYKRIKKVLRRAGIECGRRAFVHRLHAVGE